MAINTIAIKQIIAGWGLDDSDNVKYMISQMKNFKIAQSGDTTEKKDANGSTIFTVDLNKSCQFQFTTPVIDLSVIAELNGTERIDATQATPIKMAYPERFVLNATDVSNGYITLTKTPVADSNSVYHISFHTLTEDNSLDSNFEQAAAVAAAKFKYDSTNNRIYLPTDTDIFKVGTKVEAIYTRSVDSGVQIVNSATKFPDASKFICLVLACDLCQPTNVKPMIIQANAAKPETGNTIGLSLEDELDITLDLAYTYCGAKDFYTISIADESFDWDW